MDVDEEVEELLLFLGTVEWVADGGLLVLVLALLALVAAQQPPEP
jgi:hypothetical protein